MALSLLRCYSRLNSDYSFTRLVLKQNVALARLCRTRPGASITAERFCSSQKKIKILVFAYKNPFFWFRSRVYLYLIETHFNKDFNIKEFTDGATQAFCHVSGLLSRCQYEALNGFVNKNLIRMLEKRYSSLPPIFEMVLSVGPDDIIKTTMSDVEIYNDNGRLFVKILMTFCYQTRVSFPENQRIQGIMTLNVAGDEESRRLVWASYEFQREFTEGVAPDWTIIRIKYPGVEL